MRVAYSGTATVGVDFVALGSNLGAGQFTFFFPANQTTLGLTLTPINDTAVEGPETATYTFVPVPTVYVIGSPDSGTVTITSNE